MSDDSKAKKLAAARKKLKAYQSRSAADANSATTMGAVDVADTDTGSVSSISERSDSEVNLNLNGGTGAAEQTVTTMQQTNAIPTPAEVVTAANYFHDTHSVFDAALAPISNQSTPVSVSSDINVMFEPSQQHINAMQLLITEKSQLTTDLNKCRTQCREKDLELEEIRVQHGNAMQRLEDIQQRYMSQQASVEKIRNMNAELQHKLAQAHAHQEEQTTELNELKQQLSGERQRYTVLEQQLKEKSNELEMAQIRIRQLSDESNVQKDDRVESLTQTQFMYEQQIRDLQAMVQQLTEDKEQANMQYQNYVQHLKSEVNGLNEKNSELTDECTKLQEHERQLIEHISTLERDIQKNISRQDQLREEQKQSTASPNVEAVQQIEKLQEKINDLQFERHEFQLKIKSQEDRLEQLQQEQKERQSELEMLQERFEQVSSQQPDSVKLLATMESDKVAASRALSQNVEMKKQLDELEQRFVQLTNDKADLMNKLDAEEYANREMRTNYATMEERLQNIDERFKFKDEEMIRLSHENMELKQKNELLAQKLKDPHFKENSTNDSEHEREHGHHEHEHGHHEHGHHGHEHGNHHHDHGDHEHKHGDHEHDHAHHHHGHKEHEHEHHDDHCKHTDTSSNAAGTDHNHTEGTDACQEAKEHDHTESCTDEHQNHSPAAHRQTHINHSPVKTATTPHIANEEAVEKLQERFTKLISQVADLTDEKQRLEHLVLQLQGETETIGEYITLYQTQRRMLKQREYEKAAQMRLLQAEREQMREKIAVLNNLVSSLGVELPQSQQYATALTSSLPSVGPSRTNTDADKSDDVGIINEPANSNGSNGTAVSSEIMNELALQEKFNVKDTQEILHKIQNIISEIKEDTKRVPTVPPTVDHLNCCLGKFEVV